MRVDRSVVTMVDTPYHDVGAAWTQLAKGQFDTVYWRAVARPHVHALTLTAQLQP